MKKLIWSNYLFLLSLTAVYDQKSPTVTTLGGQIQGTCQTTGYFKRHSFYAFKGIPYAEPPIGDLRFRSPVPHKGWTGVRDASSFGSKCPNNGYIGSGIFSGGNEDCLFLNVYTPSLIGSLPVMVWIHPGMFYWGDGYFLVYGADYLVREDVVVVTMNYRLAALGYLSTGDKFAQGNYGLKDIKLSLEWVKQNIRAFGGNPEKITLFGQSSGAVAVNYLMVADLQEKLFHQAIMMSGSALVAATFQSNPLKYATELGHRLGLKFNSTESLVTQLRAVPVEDILKHETPNYRSLPPVGKQEFGFVPCAEPADSEEEILLSDHPANFVPDLNRSKSKIPVMIGTTSNEGAIMNIERFLKHDFYDRYNENDDYFVPLSFEIANDSLKIKEVATKFRNYYFNGKNFSSSTLNEYVHYQSDAIFKFAADRTLKIYARTSSKPLYAYNFSFESAWSLEMLLLALNYPGVSHGEDIFYLFRPVIGDFFSITKRTLTMRKRHVKLFTNFAKHGNPTPTTDDLINVTWPQYNLENEPYLDIGENLIVKHHHQQESLKMWHEFQQRFTGHL